MMASPQDSRGLSAPVIGVDLAVHSAASIWDAVAAALTTAASSARHPFHVVTVATVDAAGCPHARTVVLRGFDAPRREIRFHTDVRSPKARHLIANDRVALHWYDASARLQLRVAARATVHHDDDVARAAWHACPPMSRACYTAPEAPGTLHAAFPPAPSPPPPDDDRGLAAFAVVCCHFDDVELLALHAAGHERIRLRLDGPRPDREILAP